MDTQVDVSVIIPCLNEEKYIEQCLKGVIVQNWSGLSYELLVADGGSTDATLAIVQRIAASVPQIRLLNNSRRITPAAMNVAIMAARGKLVQLVGAHSVLCDEYIRNAVDIMNSATSIACVGGLLNTVGQRGSEHISFAMSSPFGVGDAKFRYSAAEQYVDTVAFGMYWRSCFAKYGMFDESLPANDDDEFNARLRLAGDRILLSPKLRVYYFARTSLSKLWRQYDNYARGKLHAFAKTRTVLQVRHCIPTSFVLSLLVLAGMSKIAVIFLYGLGLVLCTYVLAAMLFAHIRIGREGGLWMQAKTAAVFPIIHVAYGIGFLHGALDLAGMKSGSRTKR